MGPEGMPSTPEIHPVAPPPVPPTPPTLPTPETLRPQLGVPNAVEDKGGKSSLPDISPPGNNGEAKPPALPGTEPKEHVEEDSHVAPRATGIISEKSGPTVLPAPAETVGTTGDNDHTEKIIEKSHPDGPPAPPMPPSVETKEDNPDKALIDRIVALATKDAETELAQRLEDARKLDLGEDHIKQIETGRRERINKIAEERRTEFAAAIESARTAVQEAMIGDNYVERAFHKNTPEGIKQANDLRMALEALTQDQDGKPRVAALQISEMTLPAAKSTTKEDMLLINIKYLPTAQTAPEIETERPGTER